MPTTRLHDMVSILARLTALHKTVRFDSHTRRTIGTLSWDPKFIWIVTLEYNDEGTQLTTTGEANEFSEALEIAWIKLDKSCTKGIGEAALMPPLVQKVIENGVDA